MKLFRTAGDTLALDHDELRFLRDFSWSGVFETSRPLALVEDAFAHGELASITLLMTDGTLSLGHGNGGKSSIGNLQSIPAPAAALAVNASGTFFGYTAAIDFRRRQTGRTAPPDIIAAQRDVEGIMLGPALLVTETPPETVEVTLQFHRDGVLVYDKTAPKLELASRLSSTPMQEGGYLLLDAGIEPDATFDRKRGDLVTVGIVPVGTLEQLCLW